ncbi:hypothetical protein [Halorubellus salinus]|uniref:hypothetical protein n=1 Tax=Halorubellus salinus TaxID=755309 RepID=UPI001D096BF7|nr:hypothetical protein [Halorubellus salinus]
MDTEATFRVERDGDRVVLVPQFWPSDLDADARSAYEGLRTLHVVEDGAVSMPAEYLPAVEPGSTVALSAVWSARTERLGSLGVGPFPAGAVDGAMADRDRIARELLDDDGR